MITAKVLDRGTIELLGPFGLTNSLYDGSRQIASLDTSRVTDYALYITMGLLVMILLSFSGGVDLRIIFVLLITLFYSI